jgi:hypothetical protein
MVKALVLTGAILSTLASFACEQRARYAPGNAAQGVFGFGRPPSAPFAAAPMMLPANGFVG